MQRYHETRTMSQISESSNASDHQPLVTESGSRILDLLDLKTWAGLELPKVLRHLL